jgi:hypothetical protein
VHVALTWVRPHNHTDFYNIKNHERELSPRFNVINRKPICPVELISKFSVKHPLGIALEECKQKINHKQIQYLKECDDICTRKII